MMLRCMRRRQCRLGCTNADITDDLFVPDGSSAKQAVVGQIGCDLLRKAGNSASNRNC
jgi:hypothetical protein